MYRMSAPTPLNLWVTGLLSSHFHPGCLSTSRSSCFQFFLVSILLLWQKPWLTTQSTLVCIWGIQDNSVFVALPTGCVILLPYRIGWLYEKPFCCCCWGSGGGGGGGEKNREGGRVVIMEGGSWGPMGGRLWAAPSGLADEFLFDARVRERDL